MARTFERPATIGLPEGQVSEGAALEGLFIPAADMPECGGGLIAAPHPLMGGSMDSPVVTELAFACEKAGLASLRFNWRGVGASAGTPSGEPDDADVDYGAGMTFLRETVEGPILAAGYSFGAATAIRASARRSRPNRLLLVAPPPMLVDSEALAAFDGPILMVAGDQDRYVEVPELKALAEGLARVRVAVIRGCDHFFVEHLKELRAIADDWLERS